MREPGSTRQGRRWGAVVAFVLVWLLASSGLAQPDTTDYAVESSQWNGMSRLLDLADATGVPVEPRETLDYGELEPSNRVVVVYPHSDLQVQDLAEFVIDGGRVLLADDFGRSESLLERLDIQRRGEGAELPHDEFVQGNRSLPILGPEGVHPLLSEVSTVVANHPSVLSHRGGPVVPYAREGGLVFDMNLGEGKVIVFGDASLLINHMLQVADNRRLAANALQYLCEDTDPCKPGLYVERFEQTGRYRPPGAGDSLSEMAESFNETVASLQEEVPSSPLLYYLAVILAGGLVLYLATIFSIRRARPYSEYIDDAIGEVPAPKSEFEWNVSRFGASRRETNFALPLAILKEIFEELFLSELGYWSQKPGERPSIPEMARAFREQYLDDRPEHERDELEREVRDILANFARIPTRHRVFLDSDAYFSDRDLIKLYRRAMRILKIMGLEEEYERRTRTLE